MIAHSTNCEVNQTKILTIVISCIFAVVVDQKDGVLKISAEIKPSPRESTLIKELKEKKNGGLCADTKFCPKCTLGLDIKHTDVLILNQYLRSDGTMMPRRVTGLCATQQRNIGTMVLMARWSGMCRTIWFFPLDIFAIFLGF